MSVRTLSLDLQQLVEQKDESSGEVRNEVTDVDLELAETRDLPLRPQGALAPQSPPKLALELILSPEKVEVDLGPLRKRRGKEKAKWDPVLRRRYRNGILVSPGHRRSRRKRLSRSSSRSSPAGRALFKFLLIGAIALGIVLLPRATQSVRQGNAKPGSAKLAVSR